MFSGVISMNADEGARCPLFCVRFDLGLQLGLLFRVTTLRSLGLHLGLQNRFFECTPEIGNPTKYASKCRFSTFSARKNDTFIVLTPYYISANMPDRQCFP
jgi:hypothetical protein